MRIHSIKLNRQTMHLPRKYLPLVWFILQRPPFFTRKNGRIGTASDSLYLQKSQRHGKVHQGTFAQNSVESVLVPKCRSKCK